MGSLITFIITRTGLGSLAASIAAYAVIAALAGGGFWAWSAHKYDQGYAAGAAHEASLWQAQRIKDQAALDKAKQAAQDAVNALISQHQIDAQEAKDRQADADLAKVQSESPSKKAACLPRKIVRALNNIGK